jgi:hypothetical protein
MFDPGGRFGEPRFLQHGEASAQQEHRDGNKEGPSPAVGDMNVGPVMDRLHARTGRAGSGERREFIHS